jgi:hypothetical protein
MRGTGAGPCAKRDKRKAHNSCRERSSTFQYLASDRIPDGKTVLVSMVELYKLNRSSSLLVQCQSICSTDMSLTTILSALLVLATILGTSATRSFDNGTTLSDYDDPLDFGLTVDDIPCLGCDCCCCKTAGICCQLCPHCNPCGDGNNEDCPGPDFGCDSIPDDQDHC